MATGLLFLLVLPLLGTFRCVLLQAVDQTPVTQSVVDEQNSRVILKALFGDEVPCTAEKCEYEVTETSSEYPIVQVTEQEEETYEPQTHPDPVPQEPEEQYEPQYPEAGSDDSSQDEYETTEIDLCSTILRAAEAIESENPDMAPIKVRVLDDLIQYSTAFAQASQDEGCDPAVQLLDIIISAAEKLKETYQSASDYQCQPTEPAEEYSTAEAYSTMQPWIHGTEPELTTEYHFEEAKEPCPEDSTTAAYEPPAEKPCDGQEEEIIAEEDEVYERHHPVPPFVGSLRGVPGEHYPNYTEIPITSFSCADKCIPGFYADLETGCQVFHVCYEHRRESFLCPLGTVFNQPIMACDFWYSSNCSLAPTYYDASCKAEVPKTEVVVDEILTSVVHEKQELPVTEEYPELPEESLEEVAPFLPVKAKVTVFAEKDEPAKSEDVEQVADQIFHKIITSATHTVSKTRDIIAKLPEPQEAEVAVHIKKPVYVKPKLVKAALLPKAKVLGKVVVAKKAAVPVAKFVVAKAAVPVKAKLALKAALPVAAKAALPVAAKVVAAKAALPVAAKVVAAKAALPVAAKVIASKAALPVAAKAKVVAAKAVAAKAAVPVVAKAKAAAVAVPVAKVTAAKTKAVAGKVVAAKVAVPVGAKAIAAKKIVPVAAKTVAVKAAAVKGPALKTKILAASLPFGKAAILKSSIPVGKAMVVPALKAKAKLAAVPVVKGKMMALPLVKSKGFVAAPIIKAKIVKAAAISPLTKKALAIGYMKLLKAKKLALMG